MFTSQTSFGYLGKQSRLRGRELLQASWSGWRCAGAGSRSDWSPKPRSANFNGLASCRPQVQGGPGAGKPFLKQQSLLESFLFIKQSTYIALTEPQATAGPTSSKHCAALYECFKLGLIIVLYSLLLGKEPSDEGRLVLDSPGGGQVDAEGAGGGEVGDRSTRQHRRPQLAQPRPAPCCSTPPFPAPHPGLGRRARAGGPLLPRARAGGPLLPRARASGPFLPRAPPRLLAAQPAQPGHRAVLSRVLAVIGNTQSYIAYHNKLTSSSDSSGACAFVFAFLPAFSSISKDFKYLRYGFFGGESFLFCLAGWSDASASVIFLFFPRLKQLMRLCGWRVSRVVPRRCTNRLIILETFSLLSERRAGTGVAVAIPPQQTLLALLSHCTLGALVLLAVTWVTQAKLAITITNTRHRHSTSNWASACLGPSDIHETQNTFKLHIMLIKERSICFKLHHS